MAIIQAQQLLAYDEFEHQDVAELIQVEKGSRIGNQLGVARELLKFSYIIRIQTPLGILKFKPPPKLTIELRLGARLWQAEVPALSIDDADMVECKHGLMFGEPAKHLRVAGKGIELIGSLVALEGGVHGIKDTLEEVLYLLPIAPVGEIQ